MPATNSGEHSLSHRIEQSGPGHQLHAGGHAPSDRRPIVSNRGLKFDVCHAFTFRLLPSQLGAGNHR